eukprot:Phypoly_transcript_10745.p1 GENE.Phypoly_transcript_10745~~Phypoly_transcript_10745.p1  ORF type:complete len:218 (-),score=28.49 Phypoly_transcript_10745:452-1105(-)
MFYTSELRGAGIPERVVQRLAFLGIDKWSQICNWDRTDILPLGLLRTITGSAGLGRTYVTAEEPVVLWPMDATFVKAGNTAGKRVLKAEFNYPVKKMALVVSHKKIEEVIRNIAGGRVGIEVKIKIRNINGQKNVEKYLKEERREWEEEKKGKAGWEGSKYLKLCEEIQNTVEYKKEEGDEPAPGFTMPWELVIPTSNTTAKQQERGQSKTRSNTTS